MSDFLISYRELCTYSLHFFGLAVPSSNINPVIEKYAVEGQTGPTIHCGLCHIIRDI